MKTSKTTGKGKAKKKKDELISFEAKIVIGLALFVIASIAFFAFKISETGAAFLNSDIWFYCSGGLISAVFIFSAFYKRKERVPLYVSIFLLEYVAMFWVSRLLLPLRVQVLSDLLWAIAAVVASVISYIKMECKKERTICRFDFITGWVFLSSMMFLLYITHIGDNAFLLISLSLSITATIITVLLVIKFKDKIGEKQNRIWLPLCALLLVFFFSYIALTTINFCLDFSEPAIQSVEILDKKINSGARQATTFDLTVTINGKEKTISVPSNVYYEKERGDFISISTYKGFLNEPYYFFDNALAD